MGKEISKYRVMQINILKVTKIILKKINVLDTKI